VLALAISLHLSPCARASVPASATGAVVLGAEPGMRFHRRPADRYFLVRATPFTAPWKHAPQPAAQLLRTPLTARATHLFKQTVIS
jgi:hypothetical protein